MSTPSKFDQDMLIEARNHIDSFISRSATRIQKEFTSGSLLEIGSQDRTVISANFANFKRDTFDISTDYSPTIVGDITIYNECISDSSYDCISCLEVLEHTVDPFGAIKELRRILKDGGYLLISAPLNFRIHGPSPDCWRFTEHGWAVLLKDFDIVEIDILETPDRDLFPVKYNILAKCNKTKNVKSNEIRFRFI